MLQKREHPNTLQILIHRFSITRYYLLVSFLKNPEKKTGRKQETKCFCRNYPFEINLAASEEGNALEVSR